MVNAQEFRLFIGYEASHKQLMKDSAYMYIVLNTTVESAILLDLLHFVFSVIFLIKRNDSLLAVVEWYGNTNRLMHVERK